MLKRIVSILTLLCVLLVCVPFVVSAEDYIDGFWYRIDRRKGGVVIEYFEESGYDGTDVVIPSTIDGYNVVEIEEYAFENTGITSVTIPDTVVTIGECAFDSCHNLTEVVIGKNVKTIGAWAFSYTNITELELPDSVITLNAYAFGDCYNLEKLTLGDGLWWVGEGAFVNSALTTVELGKKVANVLPGAFATQTLEEITVDSENEWLCAIDGSLYSKDGTNLIQYALNKPATSFTIPDDVTQISPQAFAMSNNLTQINVHSGVETIGQSAMAHCFCLTDINVSQENLNYCSYDGTLYTKDMTEIIQYACGKESETFTFPDTITTIADDCFANAEYLTSIVIPENVEYVGNFAFGSCDGLKRAEINGGGSFWGGNIFDVCENLTEIVVGDNLTAIPANMFSWCEQITDVTIGENVEVIGEGAFIGCSSLEQIEIPDSVVTIDYRAFFSCVNLKEVHIGKGVKEIVDNAFRYCEAITDVYYSGTEQEWTDIIMGRNNDCLTNATMHFESSATTDETKTTTTYTIDSQGDISLTIKLPDIAITDDTRIAIIGFSGVLMKTVNFVCGDSIDGDVQTTIPYSDTDNVRVFVLESSVNLKPITEVETVNIQ